MKPYGRRRKGPCGHQEEAVFNNFYVCTVKCNGRTQCKCGSFNVEPFALAGMPDTTVHCWGCGRVWALGVDVKT